MTLTNLKISWTSIGNQIGQRAKISLSLLITWKPFEPGVQLKIQFLAEFCHPSCDLKFADPGEKCESLCFKPMTQRNLKHTAPSVRDSGPWYCVASWTNVTIHHKMPVKLPSLS